MSDVELSDEEKKMLDRFYKEDKIEDDLKRIMLKYGVTLEEIKEVIEQIELNKELEKHA